MILVIKMQSIRYSYYPKPYNVIYKEKNFETEMPLHIHNEIEIVLCVKGASSVIVGNKLYRTSNHALFFFPTNCMHKINTDEKLVYERYIMTISPTWLRNILGRDNKLHINSFVPCVISLTEDDFFRLHELFECYIKHENDEFKRLSTIFSVLDECEKLLCDENEFDISPVGNIMKYITDNITEDLKVKNIAEKFFFNPDYLCRLFKKHTNITIIEYINIQRISIAKEIIDSGDSVKAAQKGAGFNNYSNFARTFKKYYKFTPKQYQNRNYYFDTVN